MIGLGGLSLQFVSGCQGLLGDTRHIKTRRGQYTPIFPEFLLPDLSNKAEVAKFKTEQQFCFSRKKLETVTDVRPEKVMEH